MASTGPANPAIDAAAAQRLGIEVAHTGYVSTPTIELTWALILASQRHLVTEAASLRDGGWQTRLGREVSGRTLGLLGLGRVGSAVARVGLAFGIEVVAWSENLTSERASQAGVRSVPKEELFARADILSIHLVLSRRTRGHVDGQAISAMKETSWLVNTSRGPIVEDEAVVRALRAKTLAGYAVDVFDAEPLPPGHPFRSCPTSWRPRMSGSWRRTSTARSTATGRATSRHGCGRPSGSKRRCNAARPASHDFP